MLESAHLCASLCTAADHAASASVFENAQPFQWLALLADRGSKLTARFFYKAGGPNKNPITGDNNMKKYYIVVMLMIVSGLMAANAMAQTVLMKLEDGRIIPISSTLGEPDEYTIEYYYKVSDFCYRLDVDMPYGIGFVYLHVEYSTDVINSVWEDEDVSYQDFWDDNGLQTGYIVVYRTTKVTYEWCSELSVEIIGGNVAATLESSYAYISGELEVVHETEDWIGYASFDERDEIIDNLWWL